MCAGGCAEEEEEAEVRREAGEEANAANGEVSVVGVRNKGRAVGCRCGWTALNAG